MKTEQAERVMVRRCAWHEIYFPGESAFIGLKPPFMNARITHGVCKKCKVFLAKKGDGSPR